MNEPQVSVSDLQIFSNNLGQSVDARGLHRFLEVGKDFSTWMKDRIEKYGFVEGIDFVPLPKIGEQDSHGGQNRIDYALTFGMGKELAMVENNERGRQARLYFIDCERKCLLVPNFNDPAAAARAWADQYERRQLAEARTKQLQIQLDQDMEWLSIKRVAYINEIPWRTLEWRKLKLASISRHLPPKKIFDANYGEVNAYHRDIWAEVYPELLLEE